MKMISSKEALQMKMKKKLAETQLNEALPSERNARRTVAQARAIMHDIKSSRGWLLSSKCKQERLRGRKGQRQRTWQEPRQSWPRDRTVFKQFDESSWNAAPQTDAAISKTLPVPAITKLTSVRRIKNAEATWHRH